MTDQEEPKVQSPFVSRDVASQVRAAADLITSLRAELAALFGPGDHSVIGCFLVQALLGRGTVLLAPGEPRRAIYRHAHDGQLFDCDFFADAVGAQTPTRLERAGRLYGDLRELHPQHLTIAEWNALERALALSARDDHIAVRPRIAAMRRAAGLA